MLQPSTRILSAMGRDTTSVAGAVLTVERDVPAPGVVVVFAAGRPQLGALAATPRLPLGRDDLAALGIDDRRSSRKHEGTAEICQQTFTPF